MRKLFFKILIAFFYCANVLAQDINPYFSMIRSLGLGNNLILMSYSTLARTQTYQIVKNTMGDKKANDALMEEIKKIVPKYQDQWDKNLAQSYMAFITPEEAISITKFKEKSPHFKNLLASREKAGSQMERKSKPLFVEMNTQILKNLFTRSHDLYMKNRKKDHDE